MLSLSFDDAPQPCIKCSVPEAHEMPPTKPRTSFIDIQMTGEKRGSYKKGKDSMFRQKNYEVPVVDRSKSFHMRALL